LRTYTLRSALPEQVAPVLNAQLSPGSTITAYNQQLILNVTDSEYRSVLQLLEQLDVASRSLLISVRKQGEQNQQQQRYGVDGSIGSGDARVQTNGRIESGREVLTREGWQRRDDGTRIIVNQTNSSGSSAGSQQVRAVEGMRAFISAGTTLPVRNGPYGERTLTPVESGFYATARIVGDEVIVDIDQRDDRVQGRNIATQGLQTQVRGRIGEWIPLGGLNNSRSDRERGLTDYRSNNSSSLSDLSIRVDTAN
jgi:hypothetical protein